MRKLLQPVLAAFVIAVPALAAEEPEAVYAKFHKAGREANLAELRKWGTAKKGEEVEKMPAALRDSMLRFMASILPKTYVVTGRRIEGDRATLTLAAPQGNGTIHGSATLLREGGEWRVDLERWGDPAPAAAKPAPPPQQASAAPLPAGAASGSVNGAPFRLDRAELRNGILELRQGTDFFPEYAFTIFLFLKGGESLDGKRYVVSGGKEFGHPHIHLKYKVAGRSVPETQIFMDSYHMTLEFDRRSGNTITGRVDLRMPDKASSFVRGSFQAQVK